MKQGWDRSAVEGGAGGTCLVCKNGENMKKEDKHEDGVFDIDHNVESPISEDVQQVIFSPRDYLAQFYEGDVNPGNRALLRFYARIYEDLAGRSFLEFSGGPTIYSLITAARTASWIHFCDYNDECLNEVNKWLMEDDSAFDWSHFTRYALECEKESRSRPDEKDIQVRHQLIRQRIRKISRCDIFADDPLLGSSMGSYGVVAHTFCLDSIIQDKREWLHLNKKLANLVDKDGLFVTVCLLNASYWTTRGVRYPAVTLTLADVINMYSGLGFNLIHSDVVDHLEGKVGYDGFIMACGQRY